MPLDIQEIEGRSLSVAQDWQRHYERKFRVIADDPLIDPWAVYMAVGLRIGTVYATRDRIDYGAWVTGVKVDQESAEDGLEWVVAVSYGPWEPKAEDPRNDPPEVDVSFVEFEEVSPFDALTGRAIVNSAGDPFADPPLTRDNARVVLTVKRNEPNYSIGLATLYANTVNAAPFVIGDVTFPAKGILSKPIVTSRAFHADVGFYWPTTYVFHCQLDRTWQREVLDRGFRRLVAGPKLVPITVDGHPCTEPSFLNGAGQALAVGAPPVVLLYDTYPTRDFSVFNGLF
jgi:hypothetical protein